MSALEAIRFNKETGDLSVLNQLLLPEKSIYENVKNVEDAWIAIKHMKIRGAPAIAIIGSLAVAIELKRLSHDKAPSAVVSFVRKSFDYLVTARPTAVNIAEAAKRFISEAEQLQDSNTSTSTMIQILYDHLTDMLQEDIEKNRKIGEHGAQHIISGCGVSTTSQCRVLTHCNTGSLASGGYGTALGVIRTLQHMGVLERAYCTETRPYNQGSRLTAFELVHDRIPATLICDSMSSFLMQRKCITAVVVGADRVVSNGDTANKIGTYQLAVAAKHHGIPFYVAASVTTIDFNIETGQDITIEERAKQEMIEFSGKKIAPNSIDCWNPAFDVTPCELITGGIITEYGVYQTGELKQLATK